MRRLGCWTGVQMLLAKLPGRIPSPNRRAVFPNGDSGVELLDGGEVRQRVNVGFVQAVHGGYVGFCKTA